MAHHEYSIQEAAELLGVSIPKLRRWDAEGVLVAVRTDGGHRRYPRELVDQMVNAGGTDHKLSHELAEARRTLGEKHRIIQLLVESEGRYRDLVETSHDLIWAADAHGRFTYLNPAAQELFGLAPAELLGRCFSDFEADAVPAANRRLLAELLYRGEIRDYRMRLRSRNDGARWIVINARVTRNEAGEVRSIRGSARDITREYHASMRVEQPALSVAAADCGSARTTQQRMQWARKLRAALDNDALVLFAQPIVRLSDRRTTHHEILVRMRDGNGAYLSPSLFMDVAETTGMVKEIDLRVVGKLLDHLSRNGLAGAKVRYFVNLSGLSISSQEWVDRFMALLAQSDVHPNQLGFEITETAALSDVDVALRFIRRLKAIGCRIALDDFGAGFSSFHYLKQFDVDYVKIDGSFVRDLAGDRGSRLFVKALNDVAQGLNKQVIAEWVEDASAVALLQSMGTQFAQGYYFHKPRLLCAPTAHATAEPLLTADAA